MNILYVITIHDTLGIRNRGRSFLLIARFTLLIHIEYTTLSIEEFVPLITLLQVIMMPCPTPAAIITETNPFMHY